MTRGQTLAVDRTAATSAPGLTDPFPSSPYAVGRKKIRIERIADERNRQVRSRTDRTLTPRAFAGRTRESSHKALVSPRETFRTRVEPDDAFSESETAGRNADPDTS
jgi:hypothetical protein